jgi:hypothetical protein
MGSFKIITLALATAATASTFIPSAPAPSNPTVTETHHLTETVTAVPVATSLSGTSDSGMMTIVSLSTAVPLNSTVVVSHPAETIVVPVNTTITSSDVVIATSSEASPTSNLSSVVPTATGTHSGHSASASASGSAKPSTVPVNGGGKVKGGVALSLAAIVVGVLGA